MSQKTKSNAARDAGQTEYGKTIQVGNFQSKFLDSETYREGVKQHRFFRVIYYVNESGSRNRICLVETPSDQPWSAYHAAIEKVIRILAEGEKAIMKEMHGK